MKRRRILLLSAGLVVVVILAFILQDVIRQAVVTPLAYVWWLLKLAYAAVPQLLQWIFLLAVIILIAITNLLNRYSFGQPYEEPPKSAQGPVEILAGWVSNAREGNYYKWMIANRLGKLAREMPIQVEKQRIPALPGEKDDQAVRQYLQAGLEKSFVDYPMPSLPFLRRKATPFDLDVDEAVEYLESQMEVGSGQKHP